LDAGSGILAIGSANCASLHGLAPLETSEFVALDAVRAVVFIFVVATALRGGPVTVCRSVSLARVLWCGIGIVSRAAIGGTARIAHDVVKITRRRSLALGRWVARCPL
jgi:hypothetical protein